MARLVLMMSVIDCDKKEFRIMMMSMVMILMREIIRHLKLRVCTLLVLER